MTQDTDIRAIKGIAQHDKQQILATLRTIVGCVRDIEAIAVEARDDAKQMCMSQKDQEHSPDDGIMAISGLGMLNHPTSALPTTSNTDIERLNVKVDSLD
eukprot:13557346-Ditylum_brightwellii.AAC.1